MTHKIAAALTTLQAKASELSAAEDGSVSLEQALITGGLCVVGAAAVAYFTGALDGFTSRIHP